MGVCGKKLMILGAGIYQAPLIRKAVELGVNTIAVSCPGDYPGFAEADETLLVDTTDVDDVLACARRMCIDGIVTTGTDVAVRTIGLVCEELELPGINARAAHLLTDKALMKEAFVAAGVNTSPFEVVHTEGEAHAAAERLGYPVMVKACDVSGSRGVTKVTTCETMSAAYNAACLATHVDHVVVEGFVPGIEIGVDGFATDGSLVFFAPHSKFVRGVGNTTIPSGHAFPIKADDGLLLRIEKQLELVVSAFGIDESAVNGDFMVTPEGEVNVIEVGGRCGATCIPELISIYYGFDYYAQIIRTALGEPFEIDCSASKMTPCMAKLLFSDTAGVVVRIDHKGLTELARHFGAQISLDVFEGDQVEAVRDGTSRYGQVIMCTDDETEFDDVLARAASCVELL